jgi:hypothetical protein
MIQARKLGHIVLSVRDAAKSKDFCTRGHGVRGPGRQRRARRSPGGGRSRTASDKGRSVANAPLSFLRSTDNERWRGANLNAKGPVTSPHWLHMGDPGWLSLGDH